MVYSDYEIKNAVLKTYQLSIIRQLKLIYIKKYYKVKSKKSISKLLAKINTISGQIFHEISQTNSDDLVNEEILNLINILLDEIKNSLDQAQYNIKSVGSLSSLHIYLSLVFFKIKCYREIKTYDYDLVNLLNIQVFPKKLLAYTKQDEDIKNTFTKFISEIHGEIENMNLSIQVDLTTDFEIEYASTGWILPTSTFDGYTFLETLKQADEENMTMDEMFIDKLMCQSRIEETLSSWKDKNNRHVRKRILILEEAVNAHLEGKFFLSISALIPQIEGLLRDANTIKKSKYNSLEPEIIKSATESLIKQWNAQHENNDDIDKDLLLEQNKLLIKLLDKFPQIVGNLYQNYDSESATKTGLYRHGICHGMQTDFGVAKNSCRLILIIDRIIFFMKDEKNG